MFKSLSFSMHIYDVCSFQLEFRASLSGPCEPSRPSWHVMSALISFMQPCISTTEMQTFTMEMHGIQRRSVRRFLHYRR
jgi:hypothetical protein